jgi:hypothetical protein
VRIPPLKKINAAASTLPTSTASGGEDFVEVGGCGGHLFIYWLPIYCPNQEIG